MSNRHNPKHHKTQTGKSKGKNETHPTQKHLDTPEGGVSHVPLSNASEVMDHPARMLPDPSAGAFWGSTPNSPEQAIGPQAT
jgi:hypothetical protein